MLIELQILIELVFNELLLDIVYTIIDTISYLITLILIVYYKITFSQFNHILYCLYSFIFYLDSIIFRINLIVNFN